MRFVCVFLLAMVYLALMPILATGQTFVYSGRQYLQQGQSWAQIREVDLSTGRENPTDDECTTPLQTLV